VRSMRSHTDRPSRSCSVITSTSRPVAPPMPHTRVVHPPNGINQETITPPCRGISLCT
jgi:hypothetical protein